MRKSARRRWVRLEPKRRTPVGASPGTLTPDPSAPTPIIDWISYGPDRIEEGRIDPGTDIRSLLGRNPVTWINVAGLGSADSIRRLAEVFGIHPLAQEDIINAHQRPKVEQYGDHLFAVLRMFEPRDGSVVVEQLSIYCGPSFLLTFQETPGDCLDPVRTRLRRRQGKLRDRGTDYLAYALMDGVIDAYFPVLEDCGERLEDLEEEILTRPTPAAVRRIHAIRRELLNLRRAAWPAREMINALVRDPFPLIQEDTRIFLRDTYDHTVQIIDLIETYRELAADLTDVHVSMLSQRTNEIMRLLTVIATIFIPLTFFAGLWGMNFDPDSSPWNMPELRWRYGYPAALLLMAAIAAFMLVYFWRRGWLSRPEKGPETDIESGQNTEAETKTGAGRVGRTPGTQAPGAASGAGRTGGGDGAEVRESGPAAPRP